MDVTEFAPMTDSRAMRRRALEALAARTEQVYAERIALDIASPPRLAAIVAVIDEASAYWALESDHPSRPTTLEEYREIAADTYRLIGEQIPALIASAMTPDQRTRAYAEVVRDMYGPIDDV